VTEFSLLRPADLADAAARLGNGAKPLAGGTDLVPLVRDGLVQAEELVDVRELLPRGVEGERIGAGTTLAELERSDDVPEALREACRLAASPQLRNMGTIGGNLLQATRCWYWRLDFPCYLHGGDRCHAREGEHREHAFFGNERCSSAHPSDPAAALLALGATVETDRRTFELADLYRLPTDDDRDVTTLDAGELLLHVGYEPPTRASI
jgi:xanthine dehydrogenase YagS FAD-binding subunit